MTILEINDLIIDFTTETGSIRAVDDVSFSLNKGQILGIVGESGSGKSVTALSIMQLLQIPPAKISKGEIIYHSLNGESTDLLKLSEKEIRKYRGNKIAMIFQEPMTSLNPVLPCGKQVVEAILQHKKISKKQAKEQTLSLFDEVQLSMPKDIFYSYPHQISGGQKQRVMIAMAMSCKPSILIADEPTTALDVIVQKTILELMKKLQKKYRISIIFITHDLGVVAELANKVLVMYKGKIVEKGYIYDIFKNPKHPYTKGLLACRPPLNNRLYKLPGVSDFLKNGKNDTIEDFTKKFIITKKETEDNHKRIYSEEPVLKIRNIKTFFPVRKGFLGKTKNYVKAVDDVSFDVYRGETLGLVGESGCGKTTLGRSILRLIENTKGQVIFKGIDISRMSYKKLRRIRKNFQIIFQDPYSSLNPRIAIGSAIMEPMQVHKIYKNDRIRKEKVFELLAKVNLEKSCFYRYPHEFSGGQRQRICIARALSLNPEFIICDESVSSLDVSVQAQVLNLLNELKKEFHFTYIFISHDISVVKFMSDRMIVMKDGKIHEMGDPDQIYAHPRKDYTKKLINSIPRGLY